MTAESEMNLERPTPPVIDDGLVERLMDRVEAEGLELLGPDGVLTELTSRIMNRALEVEMTDHLGYEKGDTAGWGSGNVRNGSYPNTVVTDAGGIPIRVPRDREGSFEPVLVPNRHRRIAGFNDLVIGLVARGMTVRDFQAHIAEVYQVEISAELVSKITDAILPERGGSCNPGRWIRSIRSCIWTPSWSRSAPTARSVTGRSYIALAVDVDGRKHVLGLWLGTGEEGAKFWLGILTELKNRGLVDVLIGGATVLGALCRCADYAD